MNFRDIFARLGLGKNSSSVYELLLRSREPMLVAHIAKAAGIGRPEVYRNLAQLIKKGFVQKVSIDKSKRASYEAQSPRFIQQAFKKITAEVDGLLESASMKKEKELPAHLAYFKGARGIRAVFDDVIDRMPRKGTFYRYTSERNLEAVNRYLSAEYRTRRDNKKLERLVISNPTSGKTKRARLERFIKFFPPEVDLFDQNVIKLVYADSLAFINLNKEEGYIIRDKDLARFDMVIFKQLYKKL